MSDPTLDSIQNQADSPRPVEEVSFSNLSSIRSSNTWKSSTSSTSSSSTTNTPRTRNVSAGDELSPSYAEGSRQPMKETIGRPLPFSRHRGANTSGMSNGFENGHPSLSSSPRTINAIQNFEGYSNTGMPMPEAPISIEKGYHPKQVFNTNDGSGFSVGMSSTSPVPRARKGSSRRHARTMSDGVPPVIHNPQQQFQPQPYPPFHYSFHGSMPQTSPLPYPGPYNLAQHNQPTTIGSMRPRTPTQLDAEKRSFGNGQQSRELGSLPEGAPSPIGPVHYGNVSPSNHLLDRQNRRRSRHRKAKSSGAAFPAPANFASFWNATPEEINGLGGVPPVSSKYGTSSVPQSPNRKQHIRKGSFDARNEILGLTSSLRAGTSPRNAQVKSAVLNESTPPAILPTTPIMSYQKNNNEMLYTWSPSTPAAAAGGDIFAAESSFLAHKRHRESSRGRHMRQHSAQLHMENVKGQEQTPRCQDIIFFLLFVFHLIFVIYIGDLYAKEALAVHAVAEDNPSVTVYYNNLVYVASISGAFTIVLSSILLGLMTIFARHFVQVALIVVITLSFMWGTIGVGLSAKNVVPVTGIIALALSVAYAFIVWDRIPFASANLSTALSAIRTYPGIVGIAFLVQVLTLGWTIYFCIVVTGVIDAIREGKLKVSHQWEVVIYVLLGMSYYWTFQVFLHIVQVATAGVVGYWWHHSQKTGVVRKIAFKNIFYRMGPICFGSLFVGPVRLIRQVAVFFRPAPDEASLLCLHECLLCIQTCITSIVNTLAGHFNPWAFTYVGLYGYGFMDAGRQATELFEERGWTIIVSDDLVPNVLLMTSLVLGGVTGCFGFLLQTLDGLHILNIQGPHVVGFWLGAVIGVVLTSVLFGVISSSVNAVLVCFAGSPMELEENHPDLSVEMRNAWREVWPGALDVVDLRIANVAANGVGGPSLYAPDEMYPLVVQPIHAIPTF